MCLSVVKGWLVGPKNGLERGGTTDGRGRFFYRLGLFGKPLRLWALIMGLSTAPEPQTGLFR